MKHLLLLLAFLLVLPTAYAKDDSDKLDSRVAELEEVTAQQQEQIDQNDADIGWLGGRLDQNDTTLLQHQEQTDQNDADISLLFEADTQQQAQITGIQGEIEALQPADPPCFDTTNRFVDCGNGTVTDTALGLIWLKDADCFGFGHNWAEGNTLAATLADGQCGLTDNSALGDWRLPTKEEWEGIVKPSCGYPAFPDKAGWGCYVDEPWTTGIPWANLWSSTPIFPNQAWYVQTNTGNLPGYYKTAPDCRIWPVRDGR